MARSNVKINISFLASVISIVFIILMTIGSLTVVFFWSINKFTLLNSYEIKVLIFTLKQALFSSFLACLLAIPIARAIFRNDFIFKRLFINILGLPFIFPVIAAVFSIILIFGNNGLINRGLEHFGFSPLSIYGINGIILINIFFNLPLAIRFLLLAWNSIPIEQFKLARSLNIQSFDFFRLIEMPILRSTLPVTFIIIFLICITSFSVALIMGGGPNSTTLEVAIYQALIFEFNFSKAASLASIQFFLCGIIALFFVFLGEKNISFASMKINYFDTNYLNLKKNLFDWFWILLTIFFLIFPIFFLFFKGFWGLFILPPSIYLAALNSLIIALFSGILGVCIALSIANFLICSAFFSKYVEILSIFILATSPIVMGTGIFLILRPFINLEILTPILVILINATMSLPFILRALLPAMNKVSSDVGKLSDSLSITGFNRFKIIIFPNIFPVVSFCMGLGCALSMGDLGVITLFSFGDIQTLPLAIFRLMMSYKMDYAFSGSVLLIILCFLLFYLFDNIGKLYASS